MNQPLKKIAEQARAASQTLALLSSEEKNNLLTAMAAALLEHCEEIKIANNKDIIAAQAKNISPALLDRLKLDEARIAAMAQGITEIATLIDPVGKLLSEQTRPNGLQIRKLRTPIGVIAMIYEARPNVTSDVAALCLKSGNAIILRGGSEALHSNQAITNVLVAVLKKNNVTEHAIQLITQTEHHIIEELVQMVGLIDLVIPRGGEKLIAMVTKFARVPVIKNYKGICHVYVDETADINMALAICENAKCQRPSVCNAMETLLVNKNIAAKFLPLLAKKLAPYSVELRGDDAAKKIVPSMIPAIEDDWRTEYLDFILSVKVVTDVDAAIKHINEYGSHHSDSIITQSKTAETKFLQQVDSAVVYVNASTRFTDGGEFGMGAEIGISTDKLHARGPMGLEELTTYKYIVLGTGQVR